MLHIPPGTTQVLRSSQVPTDNNKQHSDRSPPPLSISTYCQIPFDPHHPLVLMMMSIFSPRCIRKLLRSCCCCCCVGFYRFPSHGGKKKLIKFSQRYYRSRTRYTEMAGNNASAIGIFFLSVILNF